MLDNIKSIFSAIVSVFNIRNKKKNNIFKNESDNEKADAELLEEDLEKEDEEMGSIKDGDHGNIKGFNRKIIKGLAAGIIVIFACALMYVVQDSSDTGKTAVNTDNRQEEAATKEQNSNNYPASYEELQRINQQKRAQNAGNNGQNHQVQGDNRSSKEPYPVSSQQLPQIHSGNVTSQQSVPVTHSPVSPQFSPYVLPSQQQTAQVKEQKEEKSQDSHKEKSLADRIKSAISFGIGTSTAAAGETSSTVSPAQSQPEGNSTGNTSLPMKLSGTGTTAAMSTSAVNMSLMNYGPRTIMAGTVIPAALVSGINSDAPGQVTAQVQQDVYDTVTKSIRIIPAGSKLIGTFGSDIQNGRVSITFSTLVLPDGECYNIGNSIVAIDKQGYTGIPGHVNNHSGKVLGQGFITSAFAALSSIAAGNVTNQNGSYTAGQLATQGAVSNMINAASQLFQKAGNLQPTVTVEPGFNFNLYVMTPMDFSGIEL